MKKVLETERLYLREFTLEDAAFTLELLNSPGWLEYIGDRNVHDLEAAKAYLTEGSLKDYKTAGFGFYIIVQKSDGALIGSSGMTKRDFLDHVDIGYALLPAYEGKGFAREATQAVMQYARQTFDLQKLIAITTEDNLRSRKLLEKLGLRHEKDISWPKTNEICMLYST